MNNTLGYILDVYDGKIKPFRVLCTLDNVERELMFYHVSFKQEDFYKAKNADQQNPSHPERGDVKPVTFLTRPTGRACDASDMNAPLE